MYNPQDRHWRSFAVMILLLLVASLPAQDACWDALERSEDFFDVAAYDEVIESLRQCPPEQLPEVRHRLRAHKLLALAHLKLGARGQAENEIEALLALRPEFEPDERQDPQEFIALVNEIKSRRPASKKWWWIGGGVVAAGVVAAILLSGDNQLKDLPEAPDPPGR